MVATYDFLIKGGTIVDGTLVACKTVRLTRPSIPCVGEAAIGSMIPGFSSVLIESLLSKPRHDILATSVHLSRPYRPGTRGYRENVRWTTTPCLCICCLLIPTFLQLPPPFYAPLR